MSFAGEYEPLASASAAFSSSPKLSPVSLKVESNTENMLSISFKNHTDEKKESNFLTLIIKI